MGRAPCCDKVGMKKGKWAAEEDAKLISYIRDNGEGSWRSLPKKAGLLRCGKSCRLRWINYLKDDLKRGNISSEEESTIIRLQAELGNRWSSIANNLPGRTDNEIKNHWNSHLRRRIESEMNKDGPPPVKKKRGRKPKPRPTVEKSESREIKSPANSTITNKTESVPSMQQEGDGVLFLDFDVEKFLMDEDLWNDVNTDIHVTDTDSHNNYNNVRDGNELVGSPVPPTAFSAAVEVDGVLNWDDCNLTDLDVLNFEPSGFQWGDDQDDYLNLDWWLNSDLCSFDL